jgi:hypothetical protein
VPGPDGLGDADVVEDWSFYELHAPTDDTPWRRPMVDQ